MLSIQSTGMTGLGGGGGEWHVGTSDNVVGSNRLIYQNDAIIRHFIASKGGLLSLCAREWNTVSSLGNRQEYSYDGAKLRACQKRACHKSITLVFIHLWIRLYYFARETVWAVPSSKSAAMRIAHLIFIWKSMCRLRLPRNRMLSAQLFWKVLFLDFFFSRPILVGWTLGLRVFRRLVCRRFESFTDPVSSSRFFRSAARFVSVRQSGRLCGIASIYFIFANNKS